MTDPIPPLIAHRGASYDAPENTPAAFDSAWEQGADGIECDVRLTVDGQVVCIHDPTTMRTAGVDRAVCDSTLDELSQLDFGSWKSPHFAGQRIVPLTDILASVPEGKQMYVEAKCGVEIAPALIAAMADFNRTHVSVISYDRDVISRIKLALPAITTYLIIRYRQGPAGMWVPGVEEIIASLRQTRADGLATHANSLAVTHVFSQSVQSAVPLLNVWPINEPADAQHFIGLGATSLTTDRPAYLRKQLSIA